MKANRLAFALLLLLTAAVSRLPAQQSEADRKLLADIRAKAEKGDAQSQFELGAAVFSLGSLGVAQDDAEAAKWFRKAAEQNHSNAQYHLGPTSGALPENVNYAGQEQLPAQFP